MRQDRHTLLLTPNWRWDCTPLSVDTLQPPVSPPLEMAYISAGIVGDHRLIDAYSANLSLDSLAVELADDPPSKIVISTAASILYWRCPPFTVDAVRAAVAVSREVCDAQIVLIGPHPTFSPDWVLDRTGADLCWRGGVERQFAAWLEGPRESRYAHRSGGASDICIEPARQIPAARMEVLPLRSPYPPHMWCVTDEERHLVAGYESGALAEASRGCPWACVYCAKAPVRDRFNRRPLEVLTEEWDELARFGVEYVFFIDETFNIGGLISKLSWRRSRRGRLGLDSKGDRSS